jgi:hypothetical protein
MKEREVQDGENIRWKCVQAFAGTNGEAAKAAQNMTENDDTVEVVCTPSGGAQTVRLQLPRNWTDDTTDEDLVRQITSLKT